MGPSDPFDVVRKLAEGQLALRQMGPKDPFDSRAINWPKASLLRPKINNYDRQSGPKDLIDS